MRVYADATNWWNASWLYRRSHLITAAAGASTNYSLQFVVINASGSDSGGTIYINNKAKADFSDVRFVSFDNSTVYSCWKEVLNSGVNATFWVRISEDLSTVNKNIWVYYGNSGASAVSNGADTFPLWFDDFSLVTNFGGVRN